MDIKVFGHAGANGVVRFDAESSIVAISAHVQWKYGSKSLKVAFLAMISLLDRFSTMPD